MLLTVDDAIRFLAANQPLPADLDLSDDQLAAIDAVTKIAQQTLDPRLVPLLINAFGEGDGLGNYVVWRGVLARCSPDVVVPPLTTALGSPFRSVREWAADLSLEFSHRAVACELLARLRVESDYEVLRFIASAIELCSRIGDADAKLYLSSHMSKRDWNKVREYA